MSLSRTLMIGRQNLFADADGVVRAHAECGIEMATTRSQQLVTAGNGFAEPLLRHLGAHSVDSLDASHFEGSTIVHDLNQPLPAGLAQQYSLVLDGGSLEHVFNFPQAIRNCMSAVAVGGHFIAVTPASNALGHGFYQFSPELYYRVLTPSNGFQVDLILIRAIHSRAHWYALRDPVVVRQRVTMASPWPILMYVVAKRIADTEPFAQTPQQSDYAVAWERPACQATAVPSRFARLQQHLPATARRAIRLTTALTGVKSGPGHFERVKLSDLANV